MEAHLPDTGIQAVAVQGGKGDIGAQITYANVPGIKLAWRCFLAYYIVGHISPAYQQGVNLQINGIRHPAAGCPESVCYKAEV